MHTLEVPVACSEPEGNAIYSEDDVLHSLAIPIPILRRASGRVW